MMMKHFILVLFLLIAYTLKIYSQVVQTKGNVPRAGVVNLSDNTYPDYDPRILHISQHPLPASEYGDKKTYLNQLRASQNIKNKLSKEKKVRGLAVNPIQFKGLTGNGGGIPLDNDIAVSNAGKVISVVNSNIRILDDTGKALQNKALTTLFNPLGSFSWISDPRVIYDPDKDRFILVCFSGSLSTTSTILIAFSQTNDPAAAWNIYKINGGPFPADSTWSDYPIISISNSDLFMTFNLVKDNVSWTVGFNQSVIWQIDKLRGYNGDTLQYDLWSNIQYAGTNLRNICPAKNQVSTMTDEMYFISVKNVALTNDTVFLLKINNSYQSHAATLTTQVLTTPVAYGFPPNVPMNNGNYLMTNDARILCAIYENDWIHYAGNTINPTYTNAGIYIGEIRNVSTVPIVSGQILSGADVEYAYPSITYIGSGATDRKILYAFSHCYTDSFAGCSVLYQNALQQLSDVVSVREGKTRIDLLVDTIERWGDYSGIQKRYNISSRAYMSNSTTEGGTLKTHIGIIDNQDIPVAITPAPTALSSNLLYPNPVLKRFTARFTALTNEKVRFEIRDLQGKMVALLINDYCKKGENEFSFSVDPLPKGMYIFSISNTISTLYTTKFVKE